MTASFTINTAPWPAGVTVPVYPARAWVDPARPPSGPTITTGIVTSQGTVTFTGLDDIGQYVAYTLGRGVRFGTSPTGLQVPVSTPDRERIKLLEDTVATGGTGGGGASTGSVLVWDTATGEYLPTALQTDTTLPREFVGPVDPSTIPAITGPVYGDRWTPTAGP